MNELVHADPCLLFALHREAAGFYRDFSPNQRFPGAPCRARFCGPAWLTVLVLEIGMGPDAARSALDWVLSAPKLDNVPYRPKLILSAGFAGALQEGVRLGDVLIVDEVVDEQGGSWRPTWPPSLAAEDWPPSLRRGRLLTTPRVIGEPLEKRRLGDKHQALAVDMETATLAALCQKQGVPFGSVRAISDEVNTRLSPQLVALLAGGQVSLLRVLGGVARSPGLLPEFWRLGRQTKLAADRLGRALGDLLTLTLPFPVK